MERASLKSILASSSSTEGRGSFLLPLPLNFFNPDYLKSIAGVIGR